MYIKIQGHRPFGSREEDLFRYMGIAAILVMWPGPFDKLLFPHPIEVYDCDWPSGFWGDDI